VTLFEPGGTLDADALNALPEDLRAAAQNLRLSSSGLQILTLKGERELGEAWRHLSAQPGLRLLTRDFAVSEPLGVQRPTKDVGKRGWRGGDGAAAPPTPSQQQRRRRRLSEEEEEQQQQQQQKGSSSATNKTTPTPTRDPDYALAAAAAGAADAAHDRALVTRAWRLTRGSSRVLVAHVDTGVDFESFSSSSDPSPFRGRLWSNPLESSGAPGVDDDENGYEDDVGGVAFLGRCVGDTYDDRGYCMECGPTGDLADIVGHGTHTAGIIAARPEEEVQAQREGEFGGRSFVAAPAKERAGGNATTALPRPAPRGVAPGARLLPLKVSDCADGVIWASGVFRAFDYALKAGAQIVSCSFAAVFPDGFGAQNLTTTLGGADGGGANGGGATSPPVAGAEAGAAVAAISSNSSGSGNASSALAPPPATPPAPASEREWARAYSAALAPLARAGVLVVAAAGNNRADLDRLSSLGYTDYPCFGQEPGLTAARALAALERAGAGGAGAGGGNGNPTNGQNATATAPLDGAAALNGSSIAPPIGGGGGAAMPAAADDPANAAPAAAAAADEDSNSLAALYWGGGGPTTTTANSATDSFFEGSQGFPNVICVGAIADTDEVPPGVVDPSLVAAPYSNFGRRSVALAAPGTVGSTRAGGGYGVQRGTSMAAPLVSGTAALALSVLGALTGNYTGRAAELRAALLAGALPMPAPPPALRRQALEALAAERAAGAATAVAAVAKGTTGNGTGTNTNNNNTAINGTSSSSSSSPPPAAFPMTGAAVDSPDPPFGARLDAEAAIRWIVDRYAPPGMLTVKPLVPLGGGGVGIEEDEAAALGNGSSSTTDADADDADADLLPGVLRQGSNHSSTTNTKQQKQQKGRVLALRGFTERMEHPSAFQGLAASGGADAAAAGALAAREQQASAPGSVRQAALPMGGLNLDGWGDPKPDATVVVAARVVLPEPGIWVFRAGSVTRPPMPPPQGLSPAAPPPAQAPAPRALSRAGVRVNGRPTAARGAPQPGPPALAFTQPPSSSRVASGDGVEGIFVAQEPGLYSLELALPAQDGASAASLDFFLKSPSAGGFARLSPGSAVSSASPGHDGGLAAMTLAAARTARGQDPALAPIPLVALAPLDERRAASAAAAEFWQKELAFLAAERSPSSGSDPANATSIVSRPFAIYYNWTTVAEAETDPSVRPLLAPSFEGMTAGAMAVRQSPRSATVDLATQLPTYTQVKLSPKIEWTDAADFQRFLDPDPASAAAGGPLPPAPPLVLARGVVLGEFELPATDSGVALVSFRALCRGCALAVDGQLVLDAWATAGTPKGANTRGDCVALATGRSSKGGGKGAAASSAAVTHTVALAFAPPPTADGRTLNTPLALSIAPCGGGSGARAGAATTLLPPLPRVLAGALTAGEQALVSAGPAVPVGATLAPFRPLEANATVAGVV
jgi:subtilisin family serine protease